MSRSDPRTASRGIVDHPAAATAALAAAVSVCAATAIVLLGDVEKRSRPRTAAAAAIAATGVPAAFALVDAILNHDDVVQFDRRVHTFMRRHRTPAGERTAKAATMIGNPWIVLALDAAAAGVLAWRAKVQEAVVLVWTPLTMGFLGEMLKHIVRRKRPPEGSGKADEFSFPSGHTLLASSSYALLADFIATQSRSRSRWVAAAAVASLIPWTALCRIYLGRHWTSDTIASAALALAWDAGALSLSSAGASTRRRGSARRRS